MFTESPTEQTTAITDLLLSLQAIGAIWILKKEPDQATCLDRTVDMVLRTA